MKKREQHGFTYLGLLVAVALLSIGLLAVSEVWTTTAARQHLVQLDWAGQQYANAVSSYYYSGQGPQRTYPESLQDLLQDKRFYPPRQHLRRLYPNPFTNQADWQMVQAGKGIAGVQVDVEMPAGRLHRLFVMPVPNGG